MTALTASFSSKTSTILDRPSFLNSLSPLQQQVDRHVGDFIDQATDAKTLGAVVGSGMAYRLARLGTLAAASSFFPEGSAIASIFAGGTSYAVGLASESATFAGINRGFCWLEGKNPDESLGKEFLNSTLSLGSLKLFGKLGEGQNLLVQHLLADTGMVASYHLAALFRLESKPEGDLFPQLLHAETMNWQMKSGMALVHQITPGLSAVGGADIFLRSKETKFKSVPLLPLLFSKLSPLSTRPKKLQSGFTSLASVSASLTILLGSKNALASEGSGIDTLEQGLLLALTAALGAGLVARSAFHYWRKSPDRLKLEIFWREKNGHAREGLLFKDQTVMSLDLPAGSSLRFDKEGRLSQIQLGADMELFKYKFMKGDRLLLSVSLGLSEVTLASDGIFEGHRYHRRDTLEFDESGKLRGANLRTDQTIQGLPLKAHSHVAFFPYGKIDLAWLAIDHEIQGIPCAQGLVSFHPNGRLKSAELSREFDIDGILLQGGTQIHLDPEGNPVLYERQSRLSKSGDSD